MEITLANRLPEGTAIHWHGMELDSHYDGAHGWSGTGQRVTASFRGAGALSIPRFDHTATLLADGTILIIGGYSTTAGWLPSAELYAPPLPAPASLQIIPAGATLHLGDARQFVAVDELGGQRFDAMWSVSDTNLATITPSSSPTLTAHAYGTVTVTATIDNVVAQAQIIIAPQSLRITPAKANLLIGHQRQFSVVDERGRPSPLATWTLSDEALAAITPDSSPVLTALIPGQVTLTATVLGVTMIAEVTILAGTTYPQGTVLWTAPVIAGFIPTGIVQTVMFDPDSTATYTVQRSTDNTESLVQAFTNDGRQLWERRMRTLLGEPVSDGKEGCS